MTEQGQDAIKGTRIYWLDNIRTFMIFLVVAFHVGYVYEASGVLAFVWIVSDPATNYLTGYVNIVADIIVMPAIFLISGYFAPLSLKSKEGRIFLTSRFKRLMIPWIVAILTLIPLYNMIFLYSRGLPQAAWLSYFHWNSTTSQNWLWFLPVLFLFNILYLFLSKVNIRFPNISLRAAVVGAFLFGFVYSTSISALGLAGWTLTPLLDFQNERLLIYFMIFLIGSLCYRLQLFESEWTNKKLTIAVYSIGWIPLALYVSLVVNFLVNPGSYIFSAFVDAQLFPLTYLLSLSYLLYVVIHIFRNFLNRQGRIGKELNKNSYHVYIIHVIVLGCIALVLLNTTIPSLVKYLIVTVSAIIVSNLLISFFRRASKTIIVAGRRLRQE